MEKNKVYPYRWVILLSAIPILAMTNVFWLSFAPITSQAEKYYNVSSLSIALLSMCYMIVYIAAALPVSYLIDKKGFKFSMTIGCLISAVFGILRGICAENYSIVLVCQLAVALAQPFLVNPITKIAANWFPVNERATASGIGTMAGYVGMIAAMFLSPRLYSIYGLPKLLMIYGYASIVCAVIFIILAKEKPETPPDSIIQNSDAFKFSETKSLFKNKSYIYLMISMFVLMGIFNGIMTYVEEMLKPKGINSIQAGTVGSVLIVVGLIGAVVLPAISDRIKRRSGLLKWIVLISVIPFLILTFTKNYTVIVLCSGLMGFLIMGMGPIAFQYGAEIAYPVPEGTSFGILMLMGQISGILFIFLMDYLNKLSTGNVTYSLLMFTIFILITFVFAAKMKESRLILNAAQTNDKSM